MIAVPELGSVGRTEFHDTVVRAAAPMVLRQQVGDWPLVAAAVQGRTIGYLREFATADVVSAIRAKPEAAGRFHYRADLSGFNFDSAQLPLPTFLDVLETEAKATPPIALAAQSIRIATHLPGLEHANAMPLLSSDIASNIWIGTAARIAAHQDPNDNLACVAAGRRRFTLFPPTAIADLYIGPLERTPAGTPISMVDVTAPDLDRFPRFQQALATAQVADLEAGDAIFIPYHWWHHVESLDPVNVLVNYWWNDAVPRASSPADAMLHAMLAIRALPDTQRAAWRAAFDHYVFAPDLADYLPAGLRGLLGPLSADRTASIKRELIAKLSRPVD